MPEPFKTSSIVLSSRGLGESDLLVDLCTPRGKVIAVAKGAKRSRRRFQNALEPFTFLEAVIVPPRSSGGLARLEAAEIMDAFPGLRRDISSFAHASLCCELAALWSQEGNPQPGLFDLLLWCLRGLDKGLSAPRVTLFFKVRLLALAGYSPEWEGCPCREAGARRGDGTGHPCPARALCSMARVATGTFKTLAHIQRARLRDLHRLNPGAQAFQQAWMLAKELHCGHLHKPPESYKVLTKLVQAES